MKIEKPNFTIKNEIEVFLISRVEIEDYLFSHYTELFELYSSNDDLESIKRAIFLQWYAVSEPQFLTGLPEFNEILQNKNLKKIEHLLLTKEIDQEFLFMLKHYYEVAE